MASEVSREKPIDYAQMARLLLDERDRGGYPIWVAGPALVHARARADLVWFIEHGFVKALLAGNAVAAHDIEASMFGTTLGMTGSGIPTQGGHGKHMRAINRVRAAGSIKAAVEQGLIPDGIMRACVLHDVPFVLAASIRDDGPLPEVITDVLVAQDEMRKRIRDVTFCLMIATTLHSIAVGNLLPAWVRVVCVDINPATVIKLNDRGSFQTIGLVTDVEPFLRALVAELDTLERKA
jgi:lysine-ketoglutarate reductase/saccharopine dehydrogenase-like protein (TIGR00300 family)